MWVCKHTSDEGELHARMQVGEVESIKVYKSSSMQVRKYAQVFNYTRMQVCMYISTKVCMYASPTQLLLC